MIYMGWVTLNGELLAYRPDGADGDPVKLDPRAHLRQDSGMGFQSPTEYGRLQLAMLDDCLQDEQAISFVPEFSSRAVFTE